MVLARADLHQPPRGGQLSARDSDGPRFSSVVAAAILFAEYFALSARFDAQPLSLRSDGWRLAGHLGALAVFVMVAGIGMFVVGFHTDRQQLRAFVVARPFDRTVAGLLALHAALLLPWWWLTTRIFGAAGPPATVAPWAWLCAWGIAGLLAATTALTAAIPPARRRDLLRAAAPLCAGGLLVGAGAWLSARGSAFLWHPFSPWTLTGAERLLLAFRSDVVSDLDQAILGTTAFQVNIAPECAGLEGVGLMTAFLTATLVLGRRELRFPHALMLLPLGLVLVWVTNLVRIVALIVVGSDLSEDVAVSGFHAKAGWIFFCALALATVALARRSGFFSRRPSTLDFAHPTAAFLLPFLALVATAFVTGLFTIEVDLLYGVRIVVGALVLAGFRGYYRRDLAVAGAGLVSAAALGLVAFAVFVALQPRPDPADLQRALDQLNGLSPAARAAWLTVRVLGSVVVIPIAEELAFRGYLYRRLIAREFEHVPPATRALLPLALSSLAFGAIHGGIAGGALAGLLFAFAMLRAGSLLAPIVAHAVANLAVAVYVMAFDQWWLWL